MISNLEKGRRIDSDIRLRYVSHMTRYAAALTEEYEVNF